MPDAATAATRVLYVLRHAKAANGSDTGRDVDRPLAPAGADAARRMGSHAAETSVRPDLVVCSPARRTRETLEGVLTGLGGGVDVRFDDHVYNASAGDLLQRLHEVDAGVRAVLVVGHNPGCHDLVTRLSGSGEEGALATLRTSGMRPGTLATIGFVDVAWAELADGAGHLESFVPPQLLG